jgi:hypothetical protein
LEAHYFNDGSFTTPISANVTDNTSSHSLGVEDSDLFIEETNEENSPQIVADNNTADRGRQQHHAG